MLTHSRTRQLRSLLFAAAGSAALLAAPTTAGAEPRPIHAPLVPAPVAQAEPAIERVAPEPDTLLAACPLDGPATFEDSWGWARSGGRSHEGVDMIADRGTLVVAVRDGEVEFKNNSLGGNAVWLTTDDGDRFYYAHLDAFEGSNRTVSVGDVIGYVGSTGNAGGPHLHFETLPGGQVENPYAHTLAACVPTPGEVVAIEVDEANVLNDPAVWSRFIPES